MVYRTFAEVFPDVSLWAVNDSDLILIGTAWSQRLRYAELRAAVESNPGARRDLRDLGFEDPFSLFAMYKMPKATLVKMAGGAELNLDDFPRLEFRAPRNLGRDTTTLNSLLMQAVATPPEVPDADAARDPTGRLALYLAYGYAATRDRATALEWVDRAARQSSLGGEGRLLKARLLAEEGRRQAAAAECRAAVRSLLPSLRMVVEVARLLDADDAVAVLREVVRRDPHLLEAQVALADALRRNGEYTEATDRLRSLVDRLPADPRIPFGLGRALLAAHEPAAALAAFAVAAKRGEGSGEFFAEQGEALMLLGRHQEAVASLRQALRANVESTTWRLNLGLSLAALGPAHRHEAAQRFREVLSIDPANTRAWEELRKLEGL
jgi:tetratricopeptide (TPR) repeat protein